MFCLPGLPFLYQGEELGLEQAVLPPWHRADPVGATVGQSRDGCRTPMPWERGPNFGFSTAADTWLPTDGRRDADTVAAQRGRPGSWLERYRALIGLRRGFEELRHHHVEFLRPAAAGLIIFRRGPLTVLANLGDTAVALQQLQPAVHGVAIYDTRGEGAPSGQPLRRPASNLVLAPAQALVVQDPAPASPTTAT